MCLTVLEVSFLVAGLWLLFTGKIPARMFQFMFGKGEYYLPPLQARLFGAVLASTLPIVFVVAVMLGLLIRENSTTWAMGFEVGYDLLVGIVAIVIARKIRTAGAPAQPARNEPL